METCTRLDVNRYNVYFNSQVRCSKHFLILRLNYFMSKIKTRASYFEMLIEGSFHSARHENN